MKNLTKQAIRDELIRLLNDKPLSKISVREICDDLGINHNTFYYYFSDIYAVIQEIFAESLQDVELTYQETDSWEKAFVKAVAPIMTNPKAVYHIYNSLRREDLENYIFSVGSQIMNRFVAGICPDLPARQEDRKLIAHFYGCALTEILLRWLEGGMKQKPEEMIDRIGFLFDGSIEEGLRRSAEQGKVQTEGGKVNG
ncbi:MAG: TetR/AcrR family transcriptional regulator [Lachnospiraceae bacterium]|jgi:AcrR family transcriptional regulator|nr:TetR/AcrR family transcriptional regulator [Lachnospiraceae bacterium]MCH4030167.1 TetR/AcrR family transcriptional regulator [Lachnospiraceae bacterium]MCH4069379.1 TetR/AcrR family transcriptional regulator [Lachnospiraceae bacterium]MCH4107685.1 TetR/AcrR family transcriptional regulator [Lachnospiraceae bacterium]MCI1301464.1 TetR/AcrR family transcriptional regulator [Lachnospiraceae bacterium]